MPVFKNQTMMRSSCCCSSCRSWIELLRDMQPESSLKCAIFVVEPFCTDEGGELDSGIVSCRFHAVLMTNGLVLDALWFVFLGEAGRTEKRAERCCRATIKKPLIGFKKKTYCGASDSLQGLLLEQKCEMARRR